MKLNRIFISAIVVLFSLSVWGQSDMVLTQRVLYTELLNPSTLGGEEQISFLSVYKTTPIKVDRSPSLLSLLFRYPFGDRLGIGVKCESEKVGLHNLLRVGANTDVSIELASEHYLTAGLNLGVENRRYEPLPDDPFNEGGVNGIDVTHYERSFFMESFAFTYRWRDLQLGVGNIFVSKNDEEFNQKNRSSLFFNGSYEHYLSNDFSLIPRVVFEDNSDLGFSADFALFGRFKNIGSIGCAYRPNKVVSGMVTLDLIKYISIAYCYDQNIGNYSKLFNSSHEISLRLMIPHVKRHRSY